MRTSCLQLWFKGLSRVSGQIQLDNEPGDDVTTCQTRENRSASQCTGSERYGHLFMLKNPHCSDAATDEGELLEYLDDTCADTVYQTNGLMNHTVKFESTTLSLHACYERSPVAGRRRLNQCYTVMRLGNVSAQQAASYTITTLELFNRI